MVTVICDEHDRPMERDQFRFGWVCTETGCPVRVDDVEVAGLAGRDPDAPVRVLR